MKGSPRKLFSLPQIAALANVPSAFVARLCKEEKVTPAFQSGHGLLFVHEQAAEISSLATD